MRFLLVLPGGLFSSCAAIYELLITTVTVGHGTAPCQLFQVEKAGIKNKMKYIFFSPDSSQVGTKYSTYLY
jgi:hypothetical protein